MEHWQQNSNDPLQPHFSHVSRVAMPNDEVAMPRNTSASAEVGQNNASNITFFARGDAADIWRVETRINIPGQPKEYLSKVLRLQSGRFGDPVSDQGYYNIWKEFIQISDILRGVEYLHTRTPPIVHGCLNANKVFVTQDGVTKIGEFGLATLTRNIAVLVPSISHAGLSRWMSPELVNFDPGEGNATPTPTTASDVWAVGCTLYEIVTGELPYSRHKHELRVRREIALG
ncbi:kinase-like protein, partial [Ceratobasidium sp. AG-I]